MTREKDNANVIRQTLAPFTGRAGRGVFDNLTKIIAWTLPIILLAIFLRARGVIGERV